jgi:hypothetical protein
MQRTQWSLFHLLSFCSRRINPMSPASGRLGNWWSIMVLRVNLNGMKRIPTLINKGAEVSTVSAISVSIWWSIYKVIVNQCIGLISRFVVKRRQLAILECDRLTNEILRNL